MDKSITWVGLDVAAGVRELRSSRLISSQPSTAHLGGDAKHGGNTAKGFVTATVARLESAGKMAHDDLVCPPPVPPFDHPTRGLALCSLPPRRLAWVEAS